MRIIHNKTQNKEIYPVPSNLEIMATKQKTSSSQLTIHKISNETMDASILRVALRPTKFHQDYGMGAIMHKTIVLHL